MVVVDVKDRKILYQLDFNSRQSFRAIGRKVGLSKDSVACRIKKLQAEGVILQFYTHYDYIRLGLLPMRFYFKYQYVTPELKKDITDHFVGCKYSVIVRSLEGSFDLIVLMLVKNIADIYPFWQETLDKYGDYFAQRVYSNYIGESIYRKSFLLDEKDDRTKLVLKRGREKCEYDDLDFQILKLISTDARTPTVEIAEKLDTTTTTINNRIKKLINLGIILKFGVWIDWKKLGYQYIKVDFYLKECSKKHQIIKYIEKNPNLVFINHTLGYADLELEFYVKNITQLHQIVEDLSAKFPKVIRNYTYFIATEGHKHFLL